MGDKRGQVTVFIIIGIILLASFFLISFFVEKRADSDFNAEEMLSDGIGQRFDKGIIEEYYLQCVEDLAEDALFLYSADRLIWFIENNIVKCSNEVEEFYPYVDFEYGKPEINVRKINEGSFYDVDINYPVLMKDNDYEGFLSSFSVKIPVKGEHKLKFDSENKTLKDEEINILDGKIKLFIPKNTFAVLDGKPVDTISYKIIRNGDQNIVIDFKPDGLLFYNNVTEIMPELKFSYEGLVFPKDFELKRDLRIGLYNKRYGKFMVTQGSYVNTTTKQIISKINHFSKFTWGVIRFNGTCDDGVGFDYTKFDELVNQTFTEIMTLHTNGSVNETVLNLGIANLMIEANGYNQTWFNFTHLYWAEENLTPFSLLVNFSNMTIPLSYTDSTSKNDDEDCNGSLNLSIDHEFDWMPPNHLWVTGGGTKSKEITIDKPGQYAVFGQVERLEFHGKCQGNEAFQLQINSVSGDISKDDIDPCINDRQGIEYLGQFELNQGLNTVYMAHTGGGTGGSVGISNLYAVFLNKSLGTTYFWIDNDGNEIRFDYQNELPRVKNLALNTEVIGTTPDVGFMSFFEYKEKLYAGTYDANPKVYSYSPWKLEATLTGAGESVFAFEEYKNNMYVVTESRGHLYKSTDGTNFQNVLTASNNLGLGISEFQGSLYAVYTNFIPTSATNGPILYKSTGGAFTPVSWPISTQGACTVYELFPYKTKLYAASYCDGYANTKIWEFDGSSWSVHKEFTGLKPYMVEMNGTVYGYEASGGNMKVVSFDGTNTQILGDGPKDLHAMVGFKEDLFFLTMPCWKSCAPGTKSELYHFDLKTNKLLKVATFDEPEGIALTTYKDAIYVGTKTHLGGTGKVYKLNVTGGFTNDGTCDDIDLTNIEIMPRSIDFRNIPITADLDVTFGGGSVSHEITYLGEPWQEYTAAQLASIKANNKDGKTYPAGSTGITQGLCWYDTVKTKVFCGNWDYNIFLKGSNVATKGYQLKAGEYYGIYLTNDYATHADKKQRTKVKWVKWPASHSTTTADCAKNSYCGAILNAGPLEKVECKED